MQRSERIRRLMRLVPWPTLLLAAPLLWRAHRYLEGEPLA